MTYHVHTPFEAAGWLRDPVKPAWFAPVTFTISLRQQNADELRQRALRVSTPGDLLYGKYYNQDDLDTLTAPLLSSYAAVVAWLDGESVVFRVEGECIRVMTIVATAERLLSTQFSHYLKDQRRILRATNYTLPPAAAAAAATIFGLRGLPAPHGSPLIRVANAQGSKPANVTPEVIFATYSIRNYSIDPRLKNIQVELCCAVV